MTSKMNPRITTIRTIRPIKIRFIKVLYRRNLTQVIIAPKSYLRPYLIPLIVITKVLTIKVIIRPSRPILVFQRPITLPKDQQQPLNIKNVIKNSYLITPYIDIFELALRLIRTLISIFEVMTILVILKAQIRLTLILYLYKLPRLFARHPRMSLKMAILSEVITILPLKLPYLNLYS